MASTSATELLERCLRGDDWTEDLLRDAMEEDGGRAFFRVVVERLGDMFEPRLCQEYVRLFALVIELVRPEFRAADLIERYERIRQPRSCRQDPKHVFVLSRVTLGADVAVTSIILDGVKRRYPEANIYLVGARKNHELFAADPRIDHLQFPYPRSGTIADRLGSWPRLNLAGSIVIDPDSRLSQLGLLPLCDEENYFFFESRAYGGESDATLVQLTREWVRKTSDVEANAYVAPHPGPIPADVVVSLGVGENQEKRIAGEFEEELLQMLASKANNLLVDEGAGGEERDRVKRLSARIPGIRTWSGAYAPFAYAITRAKLYVGYDSAGQHVAAASGTPLVSIFAGYPAERMYQRWRPDGPGRINVVKVTDRDPRLILANVSQCLTL